MRYFGIVDKHFKNLHKRLKKNCNQLKEKLYSNK